MKIKMGETRQLILETKNYYINLEEFFTIVVMLFVGIAIGIIL